MHGHFDLKKSQFDSRNWLPDVVSNHETLGFLIFDGTSVELTRNLCESYAELS
jgi:hypothetical protein